MSTYLLFLSGDVNERVYLLSCESGSFVPYETVVL